MDECDIVVFVEVFEHVRFEITREIHGFNVMCFRICDYLDLDVVNYSSCERVVDGNFQPIIR